MRLLLLWMMDRDIFTFIYQNLVLLLILRNLMAFCVGNRLAIWILSVQIPTVEGFFFFFFKFNW